MRKADTYSEGVQGCLERGSRAKWKCLREEYEQEDDCTPGDPFKQLVALNDRTT